MENIKAHLDGQLNATDASAVETHLESVPDLQEMRDQFVLITNTLKTTETGEPYGQEKLFERLSQSSAKTAKADKKLWRLATMWSILSFAVVAVVCFPMFAQSKAAAKKSSSFSSDSADYAEAAALGGSDTEVAASTPPSNGPASPPVTALENGDFTGRSQKMPLDDGLSTKSSIEGQWYRNQAEAGKSSQARESEFKSDMRHLRDQSAATGIAPNQPLDTPKGIYLERSGDVKVKVEDVGRAVNETTGLAQTLGGFVVNTNVSNGTEGGIGAITVRVPTKNFVTAMQKIEEMGERLASNSSSTDITDETVTESASMISWADEEARLIKELNASRNRDEKWRIKQQLAQVRVNLQVHRANVKSLKERGEFSTIAVQFLSGDKAGEDSSNWSGSALKDAQGGLGAIGKVLGTLAIYGLVFTPIWLPFAIVFAIIRKRNA